MSAPCRQSIFRPRRRLEVRTGKDRRVVKAIFAGAYSHRFRSPFERFEVANSATAQDPTFISSVAEVSKPGANAFQVANDYLAQLARRARSWERRSLRKRQAVFRTRSAGLSRLSDLKVTEDFWTIHAARMVSVLMTLIGEKRTWASSRKSEADRASGKFRPIFCAILYFVPSIGTAPSPWPALFSFFWLPNKRLWF